MYKEAIKLKLRVTTNKGSLSVEQLHSLTNKDLKEALEALNAVINVTSDNNALDFMTSDRTVRREDQLAFDILKDIYLDRKKDALDLQNSRDTKEHNEAILALIAEKEKEAQKDLTVEELRAKLK